MARARNIKPALFKNELLGVADPLLTLLFQSLWTLADREGRLEDRPLRIKAETFPYREGLDVNGYLTELQRLGFISRYSVDGEALIQVVNFKKHQTPHNTEKPSELPSYDKKAHENHSVISVTVKHALSNVEITAALPPDSLNLIPDSLNLIPDSLVPIPGSSLQAGKKPPAATGAVWDAYSNAYQYRYGVAPLRNAKVNGILANFIRRVPMEEAAAIATFFVSHNNNFYVSKLHPVTLLLEDAEKLRTEWATNRQMTSTRARQVDEKQANFDVVAECLRLDAMEGITREFGK